MRLVDDEVRGKIYCEGVKESAQFDKGKLFRVVGCGWLLFRYKLKAICLSATSRDLDGASQ